MFNLFFKDSVPNYFKERLIASVRKLLIYELACEKFRSLKYTVTRKKADKHKKEKKGETESKKKHSKETKKRSHSNVIENDESTKYSYYIGRRRLLKEQKL